MTVAPARAPMPRSLRVSPVIAVVRAPDISALDRVCDVLVEEGIRSVELTLTIPALLGALPRIVERYRGTADVGVGTVTDEANAQRAVDAGASYLVTPTANPAVVRLAVSQRIPVFPGGLTPSELAQSWAQGATA